MDIRVKILLCLAMLSGLLGGCLSDLKNAAQRGDVETVRGLLDQGADVNESGWGANPLELAAYEGQTEVVRLLLDRGADINRVEGDEVPTPLSAAAKNNKLEVVRVLVERGADVNLHREGYPSPLWWATENGNADIVEFLLKHGAEPGLKAWAQGHGFSARSPLEIAQDKGYGKIARLLQQAGAGQAQVANLPPSPTPSVSAAVISDVDTPPRGHAKPRPHAYAVVMGIEQYRQNLPKADFAAKDAQVTRDYLTRAMGYQEENVVVLLNDKATKTDLEKYIEHWLPNRVEKDASVFVYFSGHGAPNPKTGDAYLVPYDGDPAFVEATGYPLKRLYEQLNKLPAKEVIVMLDSCFSGAGSRSVIAKGMRPMVISVENPVVAGGRTVVLAASSGAQVSSTYDQKGHGLLTYYFLKGLQGDADRNRDGTIELSEVFDFTKPQVERTARREYNNEQTPQLLGSPELLSKGVRLVERAP